MNAIVSECWTYPLKAAGGIALEQATLTPLGIELDRKYMLVTHDNKFISQRNFPKMALLSLELRGEDLIVSYPGMGDIVIGPTLEMNEKPFKVTMHKQGDALEEILVCQLGGEKASQWFSEALKPGKKGPLKLVTRAPDFVREVESDFLNGQSAATNLSDGYPFLVVEKNDFALVNHELLSRSQPPLDVRRIRPNIVVEGLEAWSIMHNGRLCTESASLELVKPSSRCKVIRTNQDTGDIDIDSSVLSEVLPQINREMIGLNKACFGQNAVLLGPDLKSLSVGQNVSFVKKIAEEHNPGN
ncbi:MAG: MOSC N-terminal beta barrel domain-containing protein [Bdellovibrionales bacterium]|nr:MOSC N-terminal beta barrel domain-containing protein [Bdellovibrionales bacterium]